MGFLDNSSITVDAILTKRGREILSEGGDLNIVKFLLENKVKSNKNVIYFLQINAVVDYCLKNKNLKILEYIYNNYKYKINQKNLEKIKIFKQINII